ncbi:shikimate 5-dehydrogenase [Vitreoscilla sp. C1]|nr:shikimate 5-dehydrogenase [Vitreoscilla sp. C1]
MNMQTKPRYAVFGHPIAHSRSPEIHLAFALQEQVHISYDKILLPIEGFSQGVAAEIQAGLQGANVTVPFKLDACEFADELSVRAQLAGAVNTLVVRDDGSVYGDNSDGLGLMNDIEKQYGVSLQDLSVLVVGAGGAVRGILQPLLERNPKAVSVANRTVSKAQELAHILDIEALSLQDASLRQFDIIINGTSSGLSDQAPDLALAAFEQCQLAYDMVYGAKPTAFMDLARQGGAKQAADGLGMLVGQAAVSYQWWRGFQPQTESVLQSLRASLCSKA